MKHVVCKICGVAISKVQRDSHSGMCGECYMNGGSRLRKKKKTFRR